MFTDMFIEIYMYMKFHLDWLCVSELHDPYCNVWPEAVYCSITRTTMIIEFIITVLVTITLQIFVCLHLQIFEIAKCIA